jgi:hypothetical protein
VNFDTGTSTEGLLDDAVEVELRTEESRKVRRSEKRGNREGKERKEKRENAPDETGGHQLCRWKR